MTGAADRETMDPAAIRAHEKERWNIVAAGWKAWWDVIEGWSQPVSDRLIEMAGVGPGDTVLDIATGGGEPALTAARRVGPAGRVVATDQASAMMRIAAERAAAHGLDNIEFREAGAGNPLLPRRGLRRRAVPLGPDVHTRAGGGVGAYPCPPQGRRALRRRGLGGARGSAHDQRRGALIRSLLPPPIDPDIGPLPLAEASTLEGLLAAAGLGAIEGEAITVTVEFPDVADFIRYRQQVSTQDLALRENHPPEKVAEIWAAVADEAAAYVGPDGRVKLENRALIASGRRAS